MATAADRGAELTACAVFGPISELTVPGLEGRVESLSDVEGGFEGGVSNNVKMLASLALLGIMTSAGVSVVV